MNKLTIEQITELVSSDMLNVNKVINQQLTSDVLLINQLGNYIIQSGGKRFRPILVVLVANALNYQGNKHITAAAFIEFIHTATLLHDDVVDQSSLRRSKPTANALFGNAASVLVGDYIYTRSFQMMTSLKSIEILTVMSEATNAIAEGEVQQLINCNDPNISYKKYLQVIYKKTARLFEAATHCAAIIAKANVEQKKALQFYGRYIGSAFQLIDDLLDYAGDNTGAIGKNLGDDLNEGKPTLPLLHAMHHSKPADAKMIRNAIEKGNGRHLLVHILTIMNECNSLEFTYRTAEKEAEKAINVLSCIPESIYKDALINLAEISIRRQK